MIVRHIESPIPMPLDLVVNWSAPLEPDMIRLRL